MEAELAEVLCELRSVVDQLLTSVRDVISCVQDMHSDCDILNLEHSAIVPELINAVPLYSQDGDEGIAM